MDSEHSGGTGRDSSPSQPPRSTDPLGEDGRSLGSVSALRGLTAKQAVATLAVVLVLGLVGGVVELAFDVAAMRTEIRSTTTQTLDLVRGSAAEAAFQLNDELARRVVGGLAHLDLVEAVSLRDNFGNVLAHQAVSDPDRLGADGLAGLLIGLFQGETSYSLRLIYQDRALGGQDVGQLDLRLSPALMAERFAAQAGFNLTMGLVRALAICALMVLVLSVMVTRPLVRLAHAVSHVDPVHPGSGLVAPVPGHGADEIGLLVRSLNGLLLAFQRGLDARDRAEGELTALTRDLEYRVSARTRELQEALAALEREKEETERAFSSLDRAHQDLDKANRLLVESIRYARRIQAAHLPDKGALDGALADIHVCWEPLHLVGGDYFWLERFGPRSIMVVVDCTGHGVPGAFMTLVVASALDRILHEQGLHRPSEILTALDQMVRARLRQDGPDSESDDGLDAAVCVWDAEVRTVTYAGANLPLLYAEDGEIKEIRGTRASLGYRSLPPQRPFEDHVLPVSPGMVFFMLTDGVPDHMGGEPRRLLGRRRLSDLLSDRLDQPMSLQLAALNEALNDYRGDEPRRDDMTLIGFRPL